MEMYIIKMSSTKVCDRKHCENTFSKSNLFSAYLCLTADIGNSLNRH